MQELADKYAPQKEKMVTIRPRAPWYTVEIDQAKRERRRREHRWLKSGLTVHQQYYQEQCLTVNTLLLDSKKKYYNEKIDECSGDQKALFNVINKVFHNHQEPVLPSHDSWMTRR